MRAEISEDEDDEQDQDEDRCADADVHVLPSFGFGALTHGAAPRSITRLRTQAISTGVPLGTGRAPAGSPPQESNQQARRPGTSQRATRRQFAHAKRCPRTHRMGGPRPGTGSSPTCTKRRRNGHPSRRLWARALGRHVAPPPCSLLPGRAPATPGPGHSVRDPRKGSTGQVPCLDVLVEAAHLASSRPVLNRYLPDAVSVTQGLSWSRRTGVDGGSRFQSALLRDRHVGLCGTNSTIGAGSAPSAQKTAWRSPQSFARCPFGVAGRKARALFQRRSYLLTVRRSPAGCGGHAGDYPSTD